MVHGKLLPTIVHRKKPIDFSKGYNTTKIVKKMKPTRCWKTLILVTLCSLRTVTTIL